MATRENTPAIKAGTFLGQFSDCHEDHTKAQSFPENKPVYFPTICNLYKFFHLFTICLFHTTCQFISRKLLFPHDSCMLILGQFLSAISRQSACFQTVSVYFDKMHLLQKMFSCFDNLCQSVKFPFPRVSVSEHLHTLVNVIKYRMRLKPDARYRRSIGVSRDKLICFPDSLSKLSNLFFFLPRQ